MGHPLRILHVVVNMNRGGAEMLIMNLYRNMNRAKVQFDFLTFKEGAFDAEITEMGGKVHRIPYITEVGHNGFIYALKQFFQKNQGYKIIHSHMDKMSGLILQYAKTANIPIRIAHSHNTKSEGNIISKIYKWYAGSFVQKSATHFYACSNKAAKWLFGNQSTQAHLLKNGIEWEAYQFSLDRRDEMRRKLQVNEDTMILGHVGRFNHQKNHLFLIEVFSKINKKIPDSLLVLVGEGPLETEVKRKVRELNLDTKVKLLGVRSDINQLLQAFDLFLFPSFHEGLPVTLIEAQGAGLTCLISNKITREVDLGIGLIQYLSITNQRTWEKRVIDLTKVKAPRKIVHSKLAEAGYDIKRTAGLTESSYLTLGAKA